MTTQLTHTKRCGGSTAREAALRQLYRIGHRRFGGSRLDKVTSQVASVWQLAQHMLHHAFVVISNVHIMDTYKLHTCPTSYGSRHCISASSSSILAPLLVRNLPLSLSLSLQGSNVTWHEMDHAALLTYTSVMC